MEKQDIISSGLLELYVAGAASAEERALVEGWRKNDQEINAEILLIEQNLESYAFAHAIQPSASVKQHLLSKINFDINPTAVHTVLNTTLQAAPDRVVSMFPWRMAAAAAFLLLITSSVFNYRNYQRYREADLKNARSEEQIAQLSSRMSDMDNDMNIVYSKYSEPVSLHGLKDAPDAGAKIFWMKNTGEVYVDAANLPPAPAGKEYQLWGMVDGKPVDGGMIHFLPGKKYSIQKMKSFGKAQAFAITLETAGGNPTPKGTMFVMGEI